jgi:diguanylate cyclase (GGDEF)-like protein
LDRFKQLQGPILMGLLWLALARAGLWLRGEGAAVLIWLPSAVAVAALYSNERRRWPLVLGALGIAQFSAVISVGISPASALGIVAAHAAEAVICTTLALRVLGGRARVARNLGQFAGLFGAALAGSSASTLIAYAFRPVTGPVEMAWWFLATLLGIFVGVPVLLYLRHSFRITKRQARLRDTGRPRGLPLTALAMFAASTAVLEVSAVGLLWLLMAALVFAVIRYGQMGAAFGAMAIAAAATVTSLGGDSPADFLDFEPATAGLLLQLMMLAMLAVSLPIAAMLLTRNRLEKQLREQNAALENSLTTFQLAERIGGIGRWHYDIRTGRQTWSEQMLEINGLRRELAPDPGDMRDLLPDGGEVLFGEIASHRDELEPYTFDYRIKPPNGPERFLRMVVKNEFDADGRRAALFAVAVDVTEQVRREQALNLARERAIGLAAEAQKLAMTDPLTGIANRRATLDWLDRLVRASDDAEESLAVLMFDVDHFKRINDAFGHQTGDEVLKSVATLARAQLRAEDVVGRIGGEEFVCILSGLSEREARGLAERLCRAIADGSLESGLPRATISVGLAMYRPLDTPAQLLARADAALYEAKQGGRNQVRRAA